MAVSEVALTRLKLKAIADAVPGLTAARNVLGTHDLSVTDTFLATIVTDGPFLSIRPARMTDRDMTTGSMKYEVDCMLYFGFANDAEYDWTAIEDVLFTGATGLLAALGTVTNWRASSSVVASLPQSIDLSEPEKKIDKPIVAWYKLTLRFVGCN